MRVYSTIGIIEIVGRVISLFSVIIIARLLSKEDYGLYNYIVSLVMILSVIMDGGINYYTFNKSIKNDLSTINLIFNARFYFSLISIVLFIVLIIGTGVEVQKGSLFLYSATILFVSSIAWIKIFVRGQQDFKIDVITIILEPVIKLLLLLFIWQTIELSLDLLFLALFLSALSSFLIIYFLFRIKLKLHYIRNFKFNFLLNVLKESKFFLLYYMAWVGLQRIDLIFLEEKLGVTNVADYSSSYNLYLVVTLFFTSYLTGKMKSILNLGLVGQKTLIEITVLISLAIVGTLIFSQLVFEVVYPSHYWHNFENFNLIIIGLPFYVYSSYALLMLNYHQKTQLSFIILGGVLIVKISGFFILDLFSTFQFHLYYFIFEVVSSFCLFIAIKNVKK